MHKFHRAAYVVTDRKHENQPVERRESSKRNQKQYGGRCRPEDNLGAIICSGRERTFRFIPSAPGAEHSKQRKADSEKSHVKRMLPVWRPTSRCDLHPDATMVLVAWSYTHVTGSSLYVGYHELKSLVRRKTPVRAEHISFLTRLRRRRVIARGLFPTARRFFDLLVTIGSLHEYRAVQLRPAGGHKNDRCHQHTEKRPHEKPATG